MSSTRRGGSPISELEQHPTKQRESLGERWAFLRRLRERVTRLPGGELTWRLSVGLLGLLIIVVGIVLLPLPGPGWLVIFVGLGVLATEFEWAARLLRWARAQVSRWTSWIQTKPRWLQIVIGVLGLILLGGVILGCYLLYRAIS